MFYQCSHAYNSCMVAINTTGTTVSVKEVLRSGLDDCAYWISVQLFKTKKLCQERDCFYLSWQKLLEKRQRPITHHVVHAYISTFMTHVQFNLNFSQQDTQDCFSTFVGIQELALNARTLFRAFTKHAYFIPEHLEPSNKCCEKNQVFCKLNNESDTHCWSGLTFLEC